MAFICWYGVFRAAADVTNLGTTEPFQSEKQETLTLNFRATFQRRHDLPEGFFPAKPFFRCLIVAPVALIGDNVFIKFTLVPMAALLMKQVFSFVIGPIKIFSNFNRHFHGYALPMDFDMYLHDFFRPF
jgi:hypothetical protein